MSGIDTVSDQSLPVVLIHLGPRPPRFLATCSRQVNAVSGQRPIMIGPRTGSRYRGGKLDHFRATEHLSGLGLKGFWRYTCERFFVLEEHMRRTGLDRCLHIESDVLLYASPSDYDSWLTETYRTSVAVCPLTESEDTAAMMYVGSLGALSALNEGLLELVALSPERLVAEYGGPMANEMRMLRLLRDRGLADALPTTIVEGEALGSPCLFDPASYGQWVGGTHSRPGTPFAGDHHVIGRNLITSTCEVLWDAHQQVPFARDPTRPAADLWRLANLHIHSKRLDSWAWP